MRLDEWASSRHLGTEAPNEHPINGGEVIVITSPTACPNAVLSVQNYKGITSIDAYWRTGRSATLIRPPNQGVTDDW